jgi:hypothetical protein
MKNKTLSILSFLWFVCLTICFPSCSDTTSKPDQSPMKFSAELSKSNPAIVENGTLDTLETITTTMYKAGTYIYATDSVYTIRHKYVKPTVPVEPPPVVVPPTTELPPGYKLSFSNGFNSLADISLNQKPTGVPLSSFLNTSIKYSGAASFKSFTNGQSTSSGIRCEEQYDQDAANPTEFLLDLYVYFPAYKQTGFGGSVGFQYHPNNSGSANFFLYGTDGFFKLCRCIDIGDGKGQAVYYQSIFPAGQKSIKSGQWYHIRAIGKWSTGSDGYLRCYIDDMVNAYYTFSGRTQDKDGKPYLKIGQNNWGSSIGIEEEVDDLGVYAKP